MSTRPAEDASAEPEPEPEPEPESEKAAEAAEPKTLEALVSAQDVDGLIALAKAHRSGTGGSKKDLAKCLACYQAAARLGSAEAEYSAALFLLTGGVVAQDLKAGAAGLRVAADAGYVPAKVYLANLYELGVHYTSDPEKADVWYRSAARAAGVDASPESPEYARKMAELGCVRFALAEAEAPGASSEDRERYLRKAKAYGYQLKLRAERGEEGASDPLQAMGSVVPSPFPSAHASSATPRAPSRAPTRPAARAAADTKRASGAVAAEGSAEGEARELGDKPAAKGAKDKPGGKETRTAAGRVPPGHALSAFLFETLFVGAAVGAGTLARLGAVELVARGAPVPVVGPRLELIVPLFVAVLGVLPAFLTYKAGTVFRAILLGAIVAGAGYALFEANRARLLIDAQGQCLAFGVAGFLATLLVFGLLGGVKPPRKPMRRIVS